MLSLFGRGKRREILKQPFPEAWREILRANVPFYRRLPDAGKLSLEERVKVLLAEKSFTGCGGQEITDEIRVTIAGNAAVLVLGKPGHYFPGLTSILVYPGAFVPTPAAEPEPGDGMVSVGQASSRGFVVLSWKAIRHDVRHERDGHNVIMHEFAHQLDFEDGAFDGTPRIESRENFERWVAVFERELARMEERLAAGDETELDPYAAESAEEFFAVATEKYFEDPEGLAEAHRELYDVLRAFYNQDPLGLGALPDNHYDLLLEESRKRDRELEAAARGLLFRLGALLLLFALLGIYFGPDASGKLMSMVVVLGVFLAVIMALCGRFSPRD